MRRLLLSPILLICINCFSQTNEVFKIINSVKKWTWRDYADQRFNDKYSGGFMSKDFIAKNKDTLTREVLIYHMPDNYINAEWLQIHGKKNGPQILYFPDGKIHSICYYLDDKPWEAVYLADDSGRLYNPGTLSNGNGTLNFLNPIYDAYKGFTTYKNGEEEGTFVYIGIGVWIGQVKQKPECMTYNKGVKVTYIYPWNKDTASDYFDSASYKELFVNNPKSQAKIIDVKPDSSINEYYANEDMDFIFNINRATIPTGKWQEIDPKTKKLMEELEFDECGNTIKHIFYDENGKVTLAKTFPPCNKRKEKIFDPITGNTIGFKCN